MCRLRNIAMPNYQENVTDRQMNRQTDGGQSDPYVPLCFTGDTKIVIHCEKSSVCITSDCDTMKMSCM